MKKKSLDQKTKESADNFNAKFGVVTREVSEESDEEHEDKIN